jgi:hypothetical protein
VRNFTSGGKPVRTKGERGTCSLSSSSSTGPKRLVTCLSTFLQQNNDFYIKILN